MADLEGSFERLTATGSAADGMVQVELQGGTLRSVQIARNLLDPQHQRDVEKAVIAAVNEALDAQQQAAQALFDQFKQGHQPPLPQELAGIEAALNQISGRNTP